MNHSFSAVMRDPVFAPRMESCRNATIPSSVARCRETGRIDCFRLDWKPGMPNQPHRFFDSDFAKVLEGMAYMVELHPEDKALAEELDRFVDLVISAQQPDGYLNTYYTCVEPENRWKHLFESHELYCAGHLMEAAVAHFHATGNRKFVDALARYADYIGSVFGPAPGQKQGYPGHEELELALCKLADATGEKKYAELAKFFIDRRGTSPNYFEEEAKRNGSSLSREQLANRQAARPVREEQDAVGHSVRALYLYSGMADVAAATQDKELFAVCERMFDSIAQKRMYITGGCGSTPIQEQFTVDWNLPNDTSYAESCATMALVLFSRRMLEYTGRGKFADVMEQALYNGALSGISLHGDQYFYANLHEVDANTFVHNTTCAERQPWFGCSCCPTSYCRFLPQLGNFTFTTRQGEFRLDIPAAGLYRFSEGELEIGGQYPYDGLIPITIRRGGSFRLALRIPGWCRAFQLRLNGALVDATPEEGYLQLEREWSSGDRLELALEMPVEVVRAHWRVTSDAGRIALMRGPVVYALESVDNGDRIPRLILPARQEFKLEEAPGLPAGTVAIRGRAFEESDCSGGALYYRGEPERKETEFLAVPYALWQNRGPAHMAVWMRGE